MRKSAGRVNKGKHYRAELTLPEALGKFLVEFGAESKRSGGYNLPKTEIIRALIRVLMKLNVDVTGVKDEDELVERIMQAIKKK
ncbi:MAG: hypothetical protein A2536_09230 [Candidatus Firestonebacteria bacterium RIFOXYD2_FULL_39_29]|nr:MAG: hypothetical protein A2536_09230 [Candidatus Firestonebacteria bacterium RIFOXYD2_FULL_39_29]